ncbi:ABC transporter permease [Methylobacterium nodulans]|uniref:Inner-membrane translocator n=1 Tax=Methylobacterium nodulans (strain LMG 21967 / CNCM I-2342 / ORS 2060) TaxID=460265 RepID=B8IKN6_METNO|nr:ABC transporter permease [Methylobacterium nodulans]ACL56243.1 inner-membrane translocator [Methylobacterium nodulans ORS 2060]
MDPSFLVLQALSGLASAASLFVIASGLTIVFGVTRIVNFAHGSFYMLGAYLAVSLVPRLLDLSYSPWAFFLGVGLSALLVGLIGVAVEMLLLRRLYRVPELFQLLATFGVVLIVEDLVLAIWGPVDLAGPRAPSLRHGVEILGQRFPAYDLVLIGIGPAVLVLLWLLMRRTRFGILIRAATQDREMVGALGVNQARLFTLTLFLGACLAGLGGALQIPRVPANPHMDLSVITDAFVVTVIGGMGSVPGAFLAALLIGELQAFGILVLPKATLVLVFALMAVVLVVKPWGLLGRPDAASGAVRPPEGILRLRRFRPAEAALVALAAALVLCVPLLGDAYLVKVATEILVFALAAFSLQFLIGVGGLVSFGHAAYFGLGAYAAGLLVTGPLRLPMEPALLAAPLAGAAGAALFGFFIVRLSGIYLAMLTLAFAQIVYAIGFQWVEVTGGDNGIVGVWPSAWAADRTVYFYLVAALTLSAIALLRHVIMAPFGYTLRAARDSATRAEAIGLDVRTHRWLGFTLAGAAAGLAGGLYAFQKGSIDPTLAAIPLSIDFLVMVLVGGIRTVMGPLVGAGFFHALKDAVMPLTAYWRLLLGLAIIATVLIFPRGLAGAAEALRSRRRVPEPAGASA